MKIFIKHHLGLGDCFAHNGMVRKIAEDYPNAEVHISSFPHNYENVAYMYRDNQRIKIFAFDDNQTNVHLLNNQYDKVVYPHLDSGPKFNYGTYGDDSFYLQIDMNPEVRKKYFHVERNIEIENKVYEDLVLSEGITDFIFVHEKYGQNIDRKKIESDLPIVFADSKYLVLHFLKVFEMAKEVHVVSSSFLSLFMCKKYNPNTFAHLYCGRNELTSFIEKNNIKVIL